MFELSSSSRKDEIVATFFNPILVLLVLHELRVRHVVVPDLQMRCRRI